MIVQLQYQLHIFQKRIKSLLTMSNLSRLSLYNIQHLGALLTNVSTDSHQMLLFMLFHPLLNGSSCTLHTPLGFVRRLTPCLLFSVITDSL